MSSYKDIKPLADYVDRIGAEELNFRRFMVKEYRGSYYVERAIIRIRDDGTVYASDKSYAPTKEEADAIKIAVASAGWPKTIPATKAQRKDLVLGEGAEYYDFVDRRGSVIMVQERKQSRAGERMFVPWTYWTDGQWRKMEPDGFLPFWKPNPQAKKRRIMIHEGAKAASAAQRIAEDSSSAHPWAAELADYEHWGMIGGALAPHRSDYAELRAEKPLEVIYFCDNDFPGKLALKEVSKSYGRPMKGVSLDGRWKTGWDMADPPPAELFNRKKRWLGPTVAELAKSVTWATETPKAVGKGRPALKISTAFCEEWYLSVSPEVYVHRDKTNVILTKEEFNNHVRAWSDADDTARLLKTCDASKSAILKYDPGTKPGIYSSKTGRFINTHHPSGIKSEEGDAGPWLEFLGHLFPVETDRAEMEKWCATLVASPGTRMMYGVLLISETQGVGKGTLGEKILAPLVGVDNTSFPSEKDIVDSQFNYWMAHKRLAVVHEIYAGQSSKAYNTLKSTITDKYIVVNKKHQAAYEIENWMHVFACSNSPRALRLTHDDRRWFVPAVTDRKQSPEYWTKLNSWLTDEGGLGVIKRWAEKHPDRVAAGAVAPASESKTKMIVEGYSAGMSLVDDVLDRIETAVKEGGSEADRLGIKNGHAAVVDVGLCDLIRYRIYEGRRDKMLERPLTLRKIAKRRGWVIGKNRVRTKAMGRKGNDWGTVMAFFKNCQDEEAFSDDGSKLDFVSLESYETL